MAAPLARRLDESSRRTPVRPAHDPSRHAVWMGAIFVVVVTFFVFRTTVRNQFVDWDDDTTIVQNAHIRELSAANVQWMFTTFHTGHWQPLSWITLAMDSAVARALYDDPIDPRPFHFTNNVLHTLNALLLYLLALRLLRLIQRSESRGQRSEVRRTLAGSNLGPSLAQVAGAAFAALVFSVHPLRVESVAWATERRDVLSGAFFLGALLAYLKAVVSTIATGIGRSPWWYGCSIALALLCVLSKSIGVVLPAVMLILDAYPLRRLSLQRGEILSRSNWKIVAEKAPFIVLAIAVGLVAISAQRGAGAMFAADQLGMEHRLYVMVHGFAFYVVKTFAPWKLSPLYEMPYTFTLLDWSFIVSAALVVTLTIAAWTLRRRMPALLAVWCAYIVLVLPVSGLFQSGPQLAADRYSYLSCVGFALLAGGAFTQLLTSKTKTSSVGRLRSILACAFAFAIIIALGILTVLQIGIWHDTFTLWNTAIARRPETSLAYMNRGVAWARINELPRAQIDLEKAVGFWPTDPNSLQNLANVLASRGDFANSEHYARRAVEADPNMVIARIDLGFALLQLNRLDEAIEQYRAAFRLDPSTWPALNSLIEGLVAQGKRDLALQLATAAVNDQPHVQEARAALERLNSY